MNQIYLCNNLPVTCPSGTIYVEHYLEQTLVRSPPQLMCFTMHVSKTKLTFKALNYEAKHRIKNCPPFKKMQALPQKHRISFMHKNSRANFTELVWLPICIYYVEIVLYDIFSTYRIYFILITETS